MTAPACISSDRLSISFTFSLYMLYLLTQCFFFFFYGGHAQADLSLKLEFYYIATMVQLGVQYQKPALLHRTQRGSSAQHFSHLKKALYFFNEFNL